MKLNISFPALVTTTTVTYTVIVQFVSLWNHDNAKYLFYFKMAQYIVTSKSSKEVLQKEVHIPISVIRSTDEPPSLKLLYSSLYT